MTSDPNKPGCVTAPNCCWLLGSAPNLTGVPSPMGPSCLWCVPQSWPPFRTICLCGHLSLPSQEKRGKKVSLSVAQNKVTLL